MADIYKTVNFNESTLRASGVYIVEKPEAGFLQNDPTDIVGYIGTADWGPMNVPMRVYSPEHRASIFGAFNASAATDKFDMANAMDVGFSQTAEGGSIEMYGERIGDGNEAKATGSMLDTTSGSALTGATLTALYHGGNGITCTTSAGGLTGTTTVTLGGLPGVPGEVFENIPSVGAGVFWNNLMSAINEGTDLRGPSQLIRISSPNASAIAPALATVTLSGGNTGRSAVDYADLLGVDGAGPTGAYAYRAIDPKINFLVLAGLDVSTPYSALRTLAEQAGFIVFFDFAKGTSSASALTNKKGYGVDSEHVVFCLYWVKIYDSVNKKTRYVPPSYIIAPRIAALQINESPGNKQVFNILATERDDSAQQSIAWSTAEIGDLQSAGIMFIKKGIPASANVFGIRHGRHSKTDTKLKNVAHTRIKVWMERAIDQIMGPFVDQIQTEADDDPTRLAIESAGNKFFQDAKRDRIISDYSFQCDTKNNSKDDIRAGKTKIDAKAEPIGHSEFVIARLGYVRDAGIGNNPLNGQVA